MAFVVKRRRQETRLDIVALSWLLAARAAEVRSVCLRRAGSA